MRPRYPSRHVLRLLAVILLMPCAAARAEQDSSFVRLQVWMDKAQSEFQRVEQAYRETTVPLRRRLDALDIALADPQNTAPDKGFPLLLERVRLSNTLRVIEQEQELRLLRLRYRKSIEIVKMLYEKVLSMDHHFSSMKTQHGLLNLSNPNTQPEFKEVKDIIGEKVRKKFNFEMPELLQSNPYLTAAFSIVGLITGAGDEKEKKTNADRIACMLDFTVRMHNDINVIYYETGFLREANLSLKKDCETLFSDCARQVGYTIPLTTCRDNDDWERLYNMLDNYVNKSQTEQSASADNRPGQRASVNLQFSIDRVTQFIEKYSDFVSQGGEYYKKFSKIVSNYENEQSCATALPEQFAQLKNDIDQTLEKFNSAYRMPEVQGSKLKDMLYGTGAE